MAWKPSPPASSTVRKQPGFVHEWSPTAPRPLPTPTSTTSAYRLCPGWVELALYSRTYSVIVCLSDGGCCTGSLPLEGPASIQHPLTLHALPANMAFSQAALSTRSDPPQPKPDFDIREWYPQFLSCHRYFLDHAQHTAPVRALAAYINIRLPYQKYPNPASSFTSTSPHSAPQPDPQVSLIPYIRRLIATGHDSPSVLHGFFGDDWMHGVGSIHKAERRNYLFAAKSTSWMKVKQAYDMSPDESCPFLIPLREATEEEIQAAEATWSEWLAMQDWMLGPRSPDVMKDPSRVKREPESDRLS